MTDGSIATPKQERSRLSFERVLDASLQLLEERGFEAFTVVDVSERSKMSVGAIYSRFGNKESLLRAVHVYAMEQMAREQEEVVRAEAPRDLREAVSDSVGLISAIFNGHQVLLRELMHLGAVDEVVSARGSASSVELAGQFKGPILGFADQITHPDPEKAVDVAFRMAFCTFARQVMNGPTYESDYPISWADLEHELGLACTAYLQSSPAQGTRGRA